MTTPNYTRLADEMEEAAQWDDNPSVLLNEAAAALRAAEAERDRLKEQLVVADEHAEKLERLLEPYISWDGQPSAYDRLTARLAEAEKVLQPFKGYSTMNPALDSNWVKLTYAHGDMGYLSFRDLREAGSYLAREPKEASVEADRSQTAARAVLDQRKEGSDA